MAIRAWRGGGVAAVAEVKLLTVTAVGSNGDRVGITINGKTVSFAKTAAETTTTLLAAALYNVLAASTIPEFAEIAWTTSTNTVTGTHRTAGVPWVGAAFQTGTATCNIATSVTGDGPNFASSAGNWSSGTLPVDGDSLVFENSAISCLYGLTVFSAFTTNGVAVQVKRSFTGTIGLPATNAGSGSTVIPGGAGGYPEYRTRYLTIGGNATVTIGEGNGSSSQRVNIAIGTGTTTFNVLYTANPQSAVENAFNPLPPSGNNTLNVSGGDVGVATEQGQVASIQTVRTTGGLVNLGAGLTSLATIDQQGGTVYSAVSPSTSWTMGRSAALGFYTATAALTLIGYGGRMVHQSAGTLTATLYGGKMWIDLSQDPRAVTIHASSTFDDGAYLYDPGGRATLAAVVFNDASLRASTFGPTAKVTRP